MQRPVIPQWPWGILVIYFESAKKMVQLFHLCLIYVFEFLVHFIDFCQPFFYDILRKVRLMVIFLSKQPS